MFETLALWLEQHQQTCIFREYWSVQCPGCGFQTALIALLRGQLCDSLAAYPMLIPVLFTFILFFRTIIIPKTQNISFLLRVLKWDALLIGLQYIWMIFG